MKRLFRRLLRSVYTPIILGGILSVFPALIPGRALYWGTASLQFIPWRNLAFEQINQGVIPLWNNLNGMGAPFLANYQMALFYPPSWLTFVFGWIGGTGGLIWAFGILLVAHIIWAGIGMVRLTKRLGVSETGQVIAGLAFSLSGYWLARGSFFSMIWAGSWIPWVILASSNIANPVEGNVSAKRFVPTFFVICLSLQLLAGHAQLTWYSILLVGSWVLIGCLRGKDLRKGGISLARLAAGGVMAVAISAIQLIPTAEYLMNSQRADAYAFEQAMVYSFWPWRILTFVTPNLFGSPGTGTYWGYAAYWEDAVYIGLIPIILAIMTLFTLFRKNKEVKTDSFRILKWYLLASVILAFCLALGDNTPIFPWLYNNIPTFNMFQAPTRWMVVTVFAFSLLAGVQSENWRNITGRKRKRWRLAMVVASAVVIGAIAARVFMPDIQTTFSQAFFVAGIIGLIMGILSLRAPKIGTQFELVWRWVIAGVIIVDLSIANWGLNPTTRISNYLISPTTPSVEKINFSDSRIYLSTSDEYLLKFKRFLRFSDLRPIEDLSNYFASFLPNLNLMNNVSTANNFDPLTPERYSIFIRWVESLPEIEQKNQMEQINIGWLEKRVTNNVAGVSFEKLDPMMKVQWKPCVDWALTPENVLEKMKSLLAQDGRENWVVLEGKPKDNIRKCNYSIPEMVYTEASNHVSIKIQTEFEGWIFLASTWYPGWNVYVDGNKQENFRADYLFQAVHVPKGSHSVEWRYEPKMFIIGTILSGFSIILLLIWHAWPGLVKRDSKEQR